ncbi:MAG: phosphotransferase [candidate division Zixibacteria bacterium]|nr:phosphotransferase [candidate division Zixibacteria bacterium]
MPGLRALLDTCQMRARINEQLPAAMKPFNQCRISTLRFKTPANCLVGYTLSQDDPQSPEAVVINLYARGFSREAFGPASAKAQADRWAGSEAGPAVTALPEMSAILYWYPNDERLAGLRRIVERKKMQRAFHAHLPAYPQEEWRVSDRSIRLRLVRYKPERRAVLSCRFRAHHREEERHEERFVYLGVYEPVRLAAIWRTHNELYACAQETRGWTVPQPMGLLPDDCVAVSEAKSGEPLLVTLDRGRPDQARQATVLAAAAIAAFHRQKLTSLPTIGPEDLRTMISETTEMLCQVDSAHRELWVDTGQRLRSGADRTRSDRGLLVHGDLHPGQILLGEGVPALLDFDRSHQGDPVMDLGNFAAQLWVNWSQAGDGGLDVEDLTNGFIAAYSRAAESEVDRSLLRWWTAFALFRSALVPMGRFAYDWRHRAVATVEQACTHLA